MKWIGQHVYDLIARFRSDVYLEGISTSTETDMLVVDSNNKVSKRAIDAITVDVSDFMTNGSDNRVVTATGTDAMNAERYLTFQNTGNVSTLSLISDQDAGDLFSIATTTHGATTLTTTDDDATAAHFEIDANGDIILDSAGQIKLEPVAGNNILLDGTIAVDAGVVTGATSITSTAFVGALTGQADTVATIAGLAPNTATTQATQAAITTCSNLVTVGTIGTGVWEGTAIATNQQKHLATFDIRGYSTADGTNYEIPVNVTDNQAPFEHNISAGSDGLTALSVGNLLRATGCVMPYAGTLKKWKGWSTHSTTSGTVNIALFRYRPDPTSASTVSLVLLDAVAHTPAGNNTVIDIEETSFTDADVAEGDIVISGIKGSATQVTYFVSTLEVQWD